MDSYQKFEDAIVEYWEAQGTSSVRRPYWSDAGEPTSGNTPVGEASHGGGAGWEQRPIRQFG